LVDKAKAIMPEIRNVLEDQLRKSGARLPARFPWQLLIFSLAILGVTLASYFGMVFGLMPYLNSQLNGVNAQIDNLEKTVNKQQQENLINLYSQLTNIQDLLGSHVASSALFDDLEKNTYSQIYYTRLSLSLIENKLEIQGIAPNFNVLSQQLDSFKKSPLLGNVLLESAKSTTDGISFLIQAVLGPNALK